mmetsp:Transcript_11454/g.20718  ORF Transcript_11454/g.20718 Transcript_11454/m.20718 type:complete len:200 (+) Transcript_11454:712-1311(+)
MRRFSRCSSSSRLGLGCCSPRGSTAWRPSGSALQPGPASQPTWRAAVTYPSRKTSYRTPPGPGAWRRSRTCSRYAGRRCASSPAQPNPPWRLFQWTCRTPEPRSKDNHANVALRSGETTSTPRGVMRSSVDETTRVKSHAAVHVTAIPTSTCKFAYSAAHGGPASRETRERCVAFSMGKGWLVPSFCWPGKTGRPEWSD